MYRIVIILLLVAVLGAGVAIVLLSTEGGSLTTRDEGVSASRGEGDADRALPMWESTGNSRGDVGRREVTGRDGQATASLPEAATVIEIRDEIFALDPATDDSADSYRELLRRLIESGGADGLEVALEIVAGTEIWFPGKVAYLAELLSGVDDPRLQPALMRGVESGIALGRDSWIDLAKYVELLAQRGNPAVAAFTMQLIRTDYGSLSGAPDRSDRIGSDRIPCCCDLVGSVML